MKSYKMRTLSGIPPIVGGIVILFLGISSVPVVALGAVMLIAVGIINMNRTVVTFHKDELELNLSKHHIRYEHIQNISRENNKLIISTPKKQFRLPLQLISPSLQDEVVAEITKRYKDFGEK